MVTPVPARRPWRRPHRQKRPSHRRCISDQTAVCHLPSARVSPDAAQSRVVSMGGELDCTGSCVRPIRKGSSLCASRRASHWRTSAGFRLPCVGTEPCQVTVSKPTDVEVAVVKAQVCSPDAVCWDRPSPQGQTLRGLWVRHRVTSGRSVTPVRFFISMGSVGFRPPS